MITIELVRVGNQLIGRTVSDRWNMSVLTGTAYGTQIPHDRNSTEVKKLRRANPDCKFKVRHWNTPVQWAATMMERAALGLAYITSQVA